MRDFIMQIIDGIVVAVVAGLIVLILWSQRYRIPNWIAECLRRYRGRRDQRRAEQEQYLNEPVELTAYELVHRGCAGRGDEIVEPEPNTRLIGLGSCTRCGEHLSRPRAKV